MTSRIRILAALSALAAAVSFSIAACSSPAKESTDTHTDHSHASETITVTGDPAPFNADDISFASMMIPHHQQAVELSALVPDRSSNAELKTLATQISGAQQPEIDTMKAFLVQWGQDVNNPHSGHDMSTMAGMVDADTMAQLKTLSGTEFDKLWLTSMISHHQGAIEMAKTEIAKGSNADAKVLAQNIVTAQQAEITAMQKMLGTP